MIPSFKQYLVEEEREVFFTFGRMNPPTIGHGKLLNAMATKAGKNPYKVFLSQSQDAKKNPLSYEQKVKHVRKMFPKHGRNIILNKKVRNVFEAATALHNEGFNRVTMIVGSDRVNEFRALLDKYNGVKGRHGFYNFERINIVSAGDRDPDAEGIEGMSASKQRENASKNDFTSFSQGIPSSMSNKDAKKLFNDVRSGMGLKETREFKNHIELEKVSEIREKFVEGELFNEGDRVRTKSGKAGYIHRLGTNYVIVALDEGRISRQWLEDVQLDEMGFGGQSLIKDLMPGVDSFLDKLTHGKQYKAAVRTFLDLRKKNPNRARQNLVKAAKIHDVDIRTLDKLFHKMVQQGKMPKHLINYHPTYKEEVSYSPQKHEWGTDASAKKARQMTPGQSEGTDQDPDIKDRKGTQPKHYHKGLSKATKIARDRQFKKQTKMDDDNPAAYKPAPGDKGTETKPSKYTKQFKQMFGEDEMDQAKLQVGKEKERDKLKYDRILDRARLARARRKNAENQ